MKNNSATAGGQPLNIVFASNLPEVVVVCPSLSFRPKLAREFGAILIKSRKKFIGME